MCPLRDVRPQHARMSRHKAHVTETTMSMAANGSALAVSQLDLERRALISA
jgi:hypothetical protein